MAGGQGGKIITTRWPGVADDKLFEGRDLNPTDDVRRYIGWALASFYDLSPDKLTSTIFPGLDMGQQLRMI